MQRPGIIMATLAGLLVTAEVGSAQPAERQSFRREISASGVVMQPRGEFRRALRTVAGGVGAHGLMQFLMYSRDGDFPSHELIITTHGLMRLRRRSGALRPYAEGLAGFKGFSMDSRLPTSSYGIGAGMQFPLARRARVGPWERELLEIGVRFLSGGDARVDYGRSASSTRSVMVHVGMALQF
jgi:hypothetical protein